MQVIGVSRELKRFLFGLLNFSLKIYFQAVENIRNNYIILIDIYDINI